MSRFSIGGKLNLDGDTPAVKKVKKMYNMCYRGEELRLFKVANLNLSSTHELAASGGSLEKCRLTKVGLRYPEFPGQHLQIHRFSSVASSSL